MEGLALRQALRRSPDKVPHEVQLTEVAKLMQRLRAPNTCHVSLSESLCVNVCDQFKKIAPRENWPCQQQQQLLVQMKPRLSLKIIPAGQQDELKIFEFLKKYFFPDEPVSEAQKRMPKCPSEVFALRFLTQGHSYVAVNLLDPEANIIGVVLNGEVQESEIKLLNKFISQNEGTKYAEVLNFLKTIEVESRIWDHIGDNTAFKTFIITVSSAYRGLRIGQQLLERSRQRAEMTKYGHMVVDCTSFYSTTLVERLGYTCIYNLAYQDYLDTQGQVLFKTNALHTGVKVFLKHLTCKCELNNLKRTAQQM